MYYAIISDVHSNLEALEIVIKEINKRKPDRIVSPGDIVGYGANPKECLALIRAQCDAVVLGNHDEAIHHVKLRSWFNDDAREAIEWTAGMLSEEEKSHIHTWTRMIIDEANGITIAHGSPDRVDQHRYLMSRADTRDSFSAFQTAVCFVGHTHLPSLFSRSGEAKYLAAGKYPLDGKDRYILNPGSVGQPRDHNPQCSMAFFDTEKFDFEVVRLDYDNRKASNKIKRAGLPPFLGDRLL